MRDHILDVAEGLFYQEGIRAVGVDRIIADAGIAKATLYSKFASKHDLVLAYLTARSERVLASLNSALHGTDGSPAEKVMFVFGELEKLGRPGSPFRGCAFMLAVGEHPGFVDIRDIAVRHKTRFRSVFETILTPAYARSADLAEQIAVVYEGALTLLALTGDAAAVPAARRAVGSILSAAADKTEHSD